MSKFIESCKKYILNKKIIAGAYVTVILIVLVLIISYDRESKQNETMASKVGTVDPVTQLTQVPEERSTKSESRIESQLRIERENRARLEKLKKDSIDKEEAIQVAEAKRLEQSIKRSVFSASANTASKHSKNNQQPVHIDNAQDELSEFEIFKKDMAKLDSIGKVEANPYAQTEIKKEPVKTEGKSFYVYKEGVQSSPYFNSIIDTEEPTHIKAMVDEVVKVKQSSRVRIRLLDNITIDNKNLARNQYLYAHVSGFSGQRIMLTVTHMLLGDRIYPVNLEIYDLDGYPGLYVPKSSFQEFMQDFNANVTGSTDIDVSESNTSRLAQMGYNMLDNLISTSRKALQNKAKTNKAYVKYNTQVLLVNANDKY